MCYVMLGDVIDNRFTMFVSLNFDPHAHQRNIGKYVNCRNRGKVNLASVFINFPFNVLQENPPSF